MRRVRVRRSEQDALFSLNKKNVSARSTSCAGTWVISSTYMMDVLPEEGKYLPQHSAKREERNKSPRSPPSPRPASLRHSVSTDSSRPQPARQRGPGRRPPCEVAPTHHNVGSLLRTMPSHLVANGKLDGRNLVVRERERSGCACACCSVMPVLTVVGLLPERFLPSAH